MMPRRPLQSLLEAEHRWKDDCLGQCRQALAQAQLPKGWVCRSLRA